MRKTLLILSIFILSACGNEEKNPEINENPNQEVIDTQKTKSTEVEDESEILLFVKDFNDLASLSEGVPAISADNDTDENGAQVLYSSNDYGIIAIHDGDTVKSYSVVLFQSEPYEDMKGNGLNSLLHVASVLDLDTNTLIDELEKAINTEKSLYLEDNYSVMFFNHKLSGDSNFGMVIEFLKK